MYVCIPRCALVSANDRPRRVRCRHVSIVPNLCLVPVTFSQTYLPTSRSQYTGFHFLSYIKYLLSYLLLLLLLLLLCLCMINLLYFYRRYIAMIFMFRFVSSTLSLSIHIVRARPCNLQAHTLIINISQYVQLKTI